MHYKKNLSDQEFVSVDFLDQNLCSPFLQNKFSLVAFLPRRRMELISYLQELLLSRQNSGMN